MATTLAEEARRKQVEAFLVAGGSGDDDTGTTDQDTSDAEAADAEVAKQLEEEDAEDASARSEADKSRNQSDEPKSVTEAYGDWSKWPAVEPPKAMAVSSPAVRSSPMPSPTPADQKAFAPTPYDTSVDLFGANDGRYVTDPDTGDRKSTRLNSSHPSISRMPSSA